MSTTAARARLTGADSHAVFDVLMRSMAEPGTVRSLPSQLLTSGIAPAAWPILAIADVDVAVSSNDNVADPIARLLADATGARVGPIEHAEGVVLTQHHHDLFAKLQRGDALHPEQGARVALAVRQVTVGDPAAQDLVLRLSGPGIKHENRIAVQGLADSVARQLGRASGVFPAGIDSWLVADNGEIVGLPRSTRVTIGNNEMELQ